MRLFISKKAAMVSKHAPTWDSIANNPEDFTRMLAKARIEQSQQKLIRKHLASILAQQTPTNHHACKYTAEGLRHIATHMTDVAGQWIFFDFAGPVGTNQARLIVKRVIAAADGKHLR